MAKEKPIANVRPTQRQQKKAKPTVTDYESDDEEMGDVSTTLHSPHDPKV